MRNKKWIAGMLLICCLFGLTAFTGCGKKKTYIMTAGGEKQDAAFYAFYVHWQRDYMKELLKAIGYDITSNYDNPYTDTQTVKEYIIDSAKDRYLSYVVVTRKFDELGLSLSDAQLQEIDKTYNDEWIKTYGEAGMKHILETLNLTKDEFRSLLMLQAKSDALLEYYYGENGEFPITEQDKRNFFENNYFRFQYVLLSKTTEDEKDLPLDEINQKRNLAEEILKQANSGADFASLMEEYSDGYTKITDSMTETEKETAQAGNLQMATQGIICDKSGIFSQTLYNNYNMSVNSAIITKLESMENGEYAVVEISNSIWVIKKCDLLEQESYYEDRKATIYQSMYADDFKTRYTRWLSDLDYVFDDEVLESFNPTKFTDLFSDVYNLETSDSSDQ